MNQTPNYQLSQWERSDKVQMEDFNADNAKIDEALKAHDGTLAAHAAQIAKLGNCQVWTTTYTGNGTVGRDHPTRLAFPKKPLLAMIGVSNGKVAWLQPRDGWFDAPDALNYVNWSGSTASWYFSPSSSSSDESYKQLNSKSDTYYVVAFLAADK